MREQTSKIDMLITERKEAKEASRLAAESQTEQEAARNAYQTLMPLALPPAQMQYQHQGSLFETVLDVPYVW